MRWFRLSIFFIGWISITFSTQPYPVDAACCNKICRIFDRKVKMSFPARQKIVNCKFYHVEMLQNGMKCSTNRRAKWSCGVWQVFEKVFQEVEEDSTTTEDEKIFIFRHGSFQSFQISSTQTLDFKKSWKSRIDTKIKILFRIFEEVSRQKHRIWHHMWESTNDGRILHYLWNSSRRQEKLETSERKTFWYFRSLSMSLLNMNWRWKKNVYLNREQAQRIKSAEIENIEKWNFNIFEKKSTN